MKKFPLKIGKGLRLPLSFVTATQAIIARKRSGKSYLAQKLAEELLANGQQIVALDPTSVWWGLRASADGKSAGFPVVVFGGEHADAPLKADYGTEMARAVVEHGFSAIYDVGDMTADEQVIFSSDFFAELYRLNRKAIHVFIDEADVFAPQKPMGKFELRSLHALKRMVKMGGVRGIGCTLITQRSAVLNKDVLTQVDIITALRMSHPQDIKPVYDWFAKEISPAFAKKSVEALPSLENGTAVMASSLFDVGQRVKVGEKKTFNSGATPKPGERRKEPKVLAKIDIVKLGEKIAASVKKASEESVEGLKKRIAELEKRKGVNMDAFKQLQDEMAALKTRAEEAESKLSTLAESKLSTFSNDVFLILATLQDAEKVVSKIAEKYVGTQSQAPSKNLPKPSARAKEAVLVKKIIEADSPKKSAPADFTKGEWKVLNAVSKLNSLGIPSPSRDQVALFCSYSNVKSGGFTTPTASLISKGFLQVENGGRLALTLTGESITPGYAGYTDLTEFQNQFLLVLSWGQQKLLRKLLKCYPASVTRETLAAQCGYSNVKSGGFTQPLADLIRLDFVITSGRGSVQASPLLCAI